MTRVGSYRTPSDNIVELHREEGRFFTRLFVRETDHEITPEQAEETYALCMPQLGGRREAALLVPREREHAGVRR